MNTNEEKSPARNSDPSTLSESPARVRAMREITYKHSRDFVPILKHLDSSLFVSTYSAGKVAAIGVQDDVLTLEFANFRKAMGLALAKDRMAVCTRDGICLLHDAGDLAKSIEPKDKLDRAMLTRSIIQTGNIAGHEIAWSGDEGDVGSGSTNQSELWIVNTMFSCLCVASPKYSFIPRWKPSFITKIVAEDRCHLNGMAFDKQPVAVTALGRSDQARGWREAKANGGILMDFASGEIIRDGFCMPHSPRVHRSHPGKLFMLDSGRGKLVCIDLVSGDLTEVASYPGYGRGLVITPQFAIVGMSRARESSVFGGVPICDDSQAMRCGLVFVDLRSGQSVAFLEFETGVDELFDVQIVPRCRRIGLRGPYESQDGHEPVWVIPPVDLAVQ